MARIMVPDFFFHKKMPRVACVVLNFKNDQPKNDYELHENDVTNAEGLPVLVDFNKAQVVGRVTSSEISPDGSWICTADIDRLPENMPYLAYGMKYEMIMLDDNEPVHLRTITNLSLVEKSFCETSRPYTIIE